MNVYGNVRQVGEQSWVSETGGQAYVPANRASTGEVPQTNLQSYEIQIAQAEEQHEAAIQEIQRQFVFRDPGTVSSFLRYHRVIPELILEALPPLRTFFGSDAVFALKVWTDEDKTSQIYAVALWPGDARMAAQALDRFVEEWWVNKPAVANSRLKFTYELE